MAVPVRAMLHSLKMSARALKRDVHAIYLAAAAIIIVAIWVFGAAVLGWAGFAYWRQPNQAAANR
jgi:threonine/homoserine/homoserine lactone efflux protein